jgi:hypothetical protein
LLKFGLLRNSGKKECKPGGVVKIRHLPAAFGGSIFPFEIAKNCVVSDTTFHLASLVIMIYVVILYVIFSLSVFYYDQR